MKYPRSSRRKGPAHDLGPDDLYADLGLPNADERLLKATLVSRIRATLANRRLTQAKASKIMDLSSEEVSDLVAGAAAGVSAERLVRLLNLLGVSVSIALREEPNWEAGTTFVHFDREPDADMVAPKRGNRPKKSSQPNYVEHLSDKGSVICGMERHFALKTAVARSCVTEEYQCCRGLQIVC